MNSTDSCLQRLLRAAARVPTTMPAEAPFHLEARVLAAWRRGWVVDRSALVLPLIRRAFLCACAILVISGAVSMKSWTEPPPHESFIIDSAIELTLMQ